MDRGQDFFNLYSHDFVRVAVGVPRVRVADRRSTPTETIELMERAAAERRGAWRCFPSSACRPTRATTCSTSARCSTAVQDGAASRPAGVRAAAAADRRRPAARRSSTCSSTARPSSTAVACSAWCPRPTCRTTASSTRRASSRSGDVRASAERRPGRPGDVPFGSRLLFQAEQPAAARRFHVEICEDVWVPIPPSSYAALAGATVLLNLSASNITIAKADYRRQLVERPVGALPRRLPVLGRRAGRVDHRPGLGRPRADRRDRQPAGRVGALPATSRS